MGDDSVSSAPVARRGERRTPFHFGPADRRLYGCVHEPAEGRGDRASVVLCQPYGREYLNAHRAFVQLASRLAGAGFTALRFDYAGTGDSSGDEDGMVVDRWVEDVRTAVREVRSRSGVDSVSLVGLRLGAPLAVLAGVGQGIGSLVLWDPVVDGAGYLDELRRMHEQMLRYAYVAPDEDDGARRTEEHLGFPMPAGMREGIERLDLVSLTARPAGRVLLLEAEAGTATERLGARLRESSAEVEHRLVAGPGVWQKEPLHGIVPHQILEEIVRWMVDVHP
jgi:uncharacterized protein